MPGVSTQRVEVARPKTRLVASEDTDCDKNGNPFTVGEQVFLRPPSGRCHAVWNGPHRVTAIISRTSVVLNNDGIARHVSHVRSASSGHTVPADLCIADDSSSDGDTIRDTDDGATCRCG